MRIVAAPLFILAIAGQVIAGSLFNDPFADPYGARAPQGEPMSSAHVVVPADTKQYTITISSKQRTLQKQLTELIEARTLLRAALTEIDGDIEFSTGGASLEAIFTGSSKSSAPKENSLEITARYSMPEDSLLHSKRVVDAVAGVTVPDEKLFSFKIVGSRSLVAEPEVHRQKLIEKALVSLEPFRKQSGDLAVTVEDLEMPLDVRQRNEKEFVISLYYSIKTELGSADRK